MQEGLKELEVLLDPYDWFYEVCAEARRYVVYVTYMNVAQDTIIPDFVQEHQVVIHFASSAPGYKSEYLNKPQSLMSSKDFIDVTRTAQDKGIDVGFGQMLDDIDDIDDVEVPNITVLCRELDHLEKQCGSNILGEIFFEIKDGRNAVTNLSVKFPKVREAMDKLYNMYGFDILYEQLEL